MQEDLQKPSVLIVLPTLGKRLSYLRDTLKSISNQSNVAYDIVIIYPLDNRDVADLAKKYNAISVADPGGLSAALNAGIKKAKSHHKYISWIGDDDLLEKDSLFFTTQALDNNPNSPVAFGNCAYIDKDGKELFISKAGYIASWIMTWGPNLLPCPGSLFRTSSLLELGGFDESNKYSMDLEMFLRLKKLGRFIYINKTLASFRWHSDSMSVGSRDKATKEAESVKFKYTHPILKPLTPIWFTATRYASRIAANKLNKSS